MRSLLALAIGVAAVTLPAVPAPALAAVQADEDARFEAFGDRVVDEYLKLSPISATQLGEHRYDDRLPDASAAGRGATRAFADRSLAELAKFDTSKLSREHQVDAILLKNQLDYLIFSDSRLQDWAWDPTNYSSAAGAAFDALMSREFAPLPERLRSATGRLEALPAYLQQAREALVPARVPLIHAQTVAKQNPGLNALIDDILSKKSALAAADQARLERAGAAAKAAVAAHQKWIDEALIPNAKGNERIGAALYDEKLRLALNSPLGRQEIRERAERELKSLRAKMYEVAAGMIKGQAGAPPAPANPTPDQQQAVIEAGLAKVYADLPPRGQVLPFARETLNKAVSFAKAKDLIGFPTSNFDAIEMPEYARGFAVAYADMPGALEKDQRGYYDVMPIPPDWSDEQANSFLREYNKWALHELTIHEAVPGHLLQLAHSNLYKSKLRAVLQSGPMIEGWACYGQDVMADAGFLNRDPRYLLAHYKFQMRMPVNAIIDQDFHVGKLTREQAIELMTKQAFQQEREAAGKWVRLQLSSAQLPTYFVGYEEWKDFRAAAEKQPGFNLRKFHDSALSHGSPPVRFIRELTLGEPIR
ncbi:DUF885 domain-containing protein [Sphingomonas sp. SM33]|uniref:DUF885 domain-containing protein n=1 Tax=Sphingomonas telluris TaxID=2907998 RepID=A0ABS9VJ85_9SPHN|nr:DUF885 domain-containing protein [Sphingomonas telluris]MCH8614539.1 DUF885 domain-containing protein [Sphingomonas telluris]